MNDFRDQLDATLRFYDSVAERFWLGTRDHDVSQNHAALLDALGNRPGLRILDFGCGPGRDLLWFRDQGHFPVGLDGSAAFVEDARKRTGCEVWHQDFLRLDLPERHFDGVFANATLLHVPKAEILRVLGDLFACLKPEGVLFASNPRGDDEESFDGQRFRCKFRDETWLDLVPKAGFEPERHYWRPPGLPREQQGWFATVWRKPAG